MEMHLIGGNFPLLFRYYCLGLFGLSFFGVISSKYRYKGSLSWLSCFLLRSEEKNL